MAPWSSALGVHVSVALVALKLLAPPACTLPNELLALPHVAELQAAAGVGEAVLVGALVQLAALASAFDLVNESAGGGLPPKDTQSSDALLPSMKGAPLGTGLSDGLPGGAAHIENCAHCIADSDADGCNRSQKWVNSNNLLIVFFNQLQALRNLMLCGLVLRSDLSNCLRKEA